MNRKFSVFQTFETAGGFCAIAWSDAGIRLFQLPDRSVQATERHVLRRLPGAVAGMAPPQIGRAIAAAKRYFDGEAIEFSDFDVDLSEQREFSRRCYLAARLVRWGQTTTYGTLAKELDAGPEGARDVGQAMASNPVPLIVPCHRVLAAGGKLGGFSAPGGAAAKLRMLELEGYRIAPKAPAQKSMEF